MTVRSMIFEEIERIAAEQRKILSPLHDDLPLLNSGLDSLCIAVLVASLEDSLGMDPFNRGGNVRFPVTIGEFITLYENVSA